MATLEGKTVLIVGGTSGIGFGVAKASLLSLASHVIVASSSEDKVKNAVERLEKVISEKKVPGRVTGEVVDAKQSASIKQLLAKVGVIDHLVWTAGDGVRLSPLAATDVDASKDRFDVRFWGTVTAAQAAQINPGGSITLTTGTVLVKPRPGWSLGSAGAGAVDSFTRGLAVDLAPIRVNSVCPGAVETELWNAMPKEQIAALMNTLTDKLLVKHVADPDEVAEAYLFLMKCGYITGQRIEVDGGARFI